MAKKTSLKSRPYFDNAILLDVVIRASLAVFFAFSAGIYYHNAVLLVHNSSMTQFDVASFSTGLSILAGALYTMMIACLYVLRYRPVNKFAGFGPSLAAVLGGFLMFGLAWFKPRTDLPVDVRLLASGLILVGNVLAGYILMHLGRSFSILPEGRKLVMKGPYRFIRHPLYIAEMIATLGQMILFLSMGAVILVIIQTTMQVIRIYYEERVLTKTFPEYKNYARRTARFIPGVY